MSDISDDDVLAILNGDYPAAEERPARDGRDTRNVRPNGDTNNRNDRTFDDLPDNDTDLLGLDTELKISKKRKTVKLDAERILSSKGLPYIRNNYKRIKLESKNEVQNMKNMLDFYQLWCHNLFPRANFQDCLSLINDLGKKDKLVKEARSKYLQTEMDVNRALNSDDPNTLNDVFSYDTQRSSTTIQNLSQDQSQQSQTQTQTQTQREQVSSAPSSNGLFVGEDDIDDDLYTTPAARVQQINPAPQANIAPSTTTRSPNTNNDELSLDDIDFSDDEEELNELLKKSKSANGEEEVDMNDFELSNTKPSTISDNNEDDDDDYDNEMDIMREMGM